MRLTCSEASELRASYEIHHLLDAVCQNLWSLKQELQYLDLAHVANFL